MDAAFLLCPDFPGIAIASSDVCMMWLLDLLWRELSHQLFVAV